MPSCNALALHHSAGSDDEPVSFSVQHDTIPGVSAGVSCEDIRTLLTCGQRWQQHCGVWESKEMLRLIGYGLMTPVMQTANGCLESAAGPRAYVTYMENFLDIQDAKQ